MNVLAIGAHFDDIELGCGGCLAKHVKNGDRVIIYVATDSAYGTYDGKSIRGSEEARAEGESASRIIGAEIIFGTVQTFHLEFEEDINRELVGIIEENKIECVYTHWAYDVHHDHYHLSRATLHATRHVPRVLMYRSNWYTGMESFRGNFFVDISETWDIKRRAIIAHESEMRRTGNSWLDYFDRESLNDGKKIGVQRAERFEVVKWME